MGQLSRIIDDVREFHEVFAPNWLPGPTPAPLTLDEALTRSKWVRSEMAELERDTPTQGQLLHVDGEDAIDVVDVMAKQADAFLDAIYFAAGGLVRMGLDPSPLWQIVHAEGNMAKRQPDGSVKRRESDGKVVKPEGWVDPHEKLVAEIRRQLDLHSRINTAEIRRQLDQGVGYLHVDDSANDAEADRFFGEPGSVPPTHRDPLGQGL